MPHIDQTVFISYRRANFPWALAIYQRLKAKGYDVFFAYQSVNPGDYEPVILGNIKARAHFLALLTPSALERSDEQGDPLHREVEAALEMRRDIIPLLLEGSDFNTPLISRRLTGSLEALKSYPALGISADNFDDTVERLCTRFLNAPVEAELQPIAGPAGQATQAQQHAADQAPLATQQELSAQEWFERGYLHADAENYAEAIECYTQSLSLQPGNAHACNYRGLARANQGDSGGAFQDYDQALHLDPDFASAYYNRGGLRADLGDLDKAIQDYDRAIRLQPDYARTYNNRGVARYIQGNLEDAIQDFEEALRLDSSYADAYSNRGIALKAKGDFQGALQDFDQVLRLQPEFGLGYNNRGNTRKALGDLAGAIQDFDYALYLDPDDAIAYYNRGMMRFYAGDPQKAIQDFDRALQLAPGFELARQNRELAIYALKGKDN